MLGYKFRRQWQTAIESFGIHFLRFRNVEVFEHPDVVLGAIERHLLELRAKQKTPLKSPLVQGGTFETRQNGETRRVSAPHQAAKAACSWGEPRSEERRVGKECRL